MIRVKWIPLFIWSLIAVGVLAFTSCIHLREKVYLDVYQGEPLTFEEMVDSLAKTKIVFLGEVHTIERHHRFQHRVIKELFQKEIPLVIGLEMLPFTCQNGLDLWIAGKMEKAEFLKLINWQENWTIDFGLYEPIFDFAREKKIPLVALNAPRLLVKKVARKGIQG